MKKMALYITMLLLPLLSVSAANVETKGANVSFDMPSMKSVVNLCFSSVAIPYENEMRVETSNYRDYENIMNPSNIVTSIPLDVRTGTDGIRGYNSSKLYISFQVFAGNAIDIVVSPSGPLKEQNGNGLLNWQVSGNGRTAGSLENNRGETSYANNRGLVVYSSDQSRWGISGSRELEILTQELSAGNAGTYTSSLIATVKVR